MLTSHTCLVSTVPDGADTEHLHHLMLKMLILEHVFVLRIRNKFIVGTYYSVQEAYGIHPWEIGVKLQYLRSDSMPMYLGPCRVCQKEGCWG